MSVNYAPSDPVAGASRASGDTEVIRWTDYADTIADVDTRLDALEALGVAASVHATATAGPSSTSETTLATLAVPSGLATGDRLIVKILADYLNNSGSAVTYTPRFKLGATTIGGGQAGSVASNANRRYFFATAELTVESTNAQRFGGMCSFMGGGVAWDANPPGNLIMYGVATENLGSALNLTFTMQLGTSHANASFALQAASLIVAKA